MIRRREALIALGTGALAMRVARASAQAKAKVVRIGLLDYAAPDPAGRARWQAFRDRLRELGYVEGQNLVIEARWADGQVSRLPTLVAELINAKVDIIVTAGSEAALAAKRATSSIPIVMTTGGDPVALGLVAGLARPGGNVTGVTSVSTELAAKRLELLRQLLPRVARVAILWDADNHASELIVRHTEAAAKSLGITLQSAAVRSPKEVDPALAAMKRDRAAAVILVASPAFMSDRRHIVELAVAHRLPMTVGSREYAEAGALLSYGTDYPDLFRRAAAYVDKILKGAKPADLPVEQPTKFELIVNLRTAKALRLTIPQSLLQRADEIIQ